MARPHDHAVGRRAPDREMTRPDFAQAKRIVQRQRMRAAGLNELRRHHPNIVRQRAGDLLDDLHAVAEDARAISAENHSPYKCPVEQAPGRSDARATPTQAAKPIPGTSWITRA